MPHSKINPKWIKDPNCKAKTLKCLEENRGKNLHGIGFGSDFLYDTKSIGNKNKDK